MIANRSMSRILFALLVAAGTCAGASASRAAAAPIPPSAILPISEVREGMTGVGYSVFQGTQGDTVSVSILGVRKSYRPGCDLILARASSPVVDKTGSSAGVSGRAGYSGG